MLAAWWFIRKAPCCWLRCRPGPTTTLADMQADIGVVLDNLTGAGLIDRWWETVYEPEVCGPHGMDIAHTSSDDIERRVALRMTRQQVLAQSEAPSLWAVLDEAALRRPLGSREILRVQLQHLIEMTELPNVTLQVVPFHVGGHSATGAGGFTILRFAQSDLPDIVYLEQLDSALYLDKKRDTDNYLTIMDSLCIQADSPAETTNFLHRILKES